MPRSSKLPVMIFADGASSGNPGPGGWGAILVDPEGRVTELGGGVASTTNNRMEMMAALQALRQVKIRGLASEPVEVYTDSVYLIRGITQWVFGWRKKDWKNAAGVEVANQDLWRELMGAVAGLKISWRFIRGHAGIPGNERVDEIAVAFSKGARPGLYDGPLLQYGVAIHDLPESFALPEMKPREEKVAAFSYLSLLGGSAMRHANWASCERRVKGRSGAKFKKAMSASEEQEILRSWGVSPSELKSDEG